MPSLDSDRILKKLHELRSVFEVGQRAMPLVEELVHFMQDVTPLLEHIDSSMRASTQKMPQATTQLENVSQATELATTEILDIVDDVIDAVDAVEADLEPSEERAARIRSHDETVLALLRDTLGEEHEVIAQVETSFAKREQEIAEMTEAMNEQIEILAGMRQKSSRIMMSLQVQDITSQQIAAVNHLIISIRRHMHQLIEKLNQVPSDDQVATLEQLINKTDGTFDANASYDTSGSRQQNADQVIQNVAEEETSDDTPEVASQDDIDAMFGGGSKTPAAPASQDDIDSMFSPAPSAGGPASQDDIDAMFGGGSETPSQPASQDDIDSMFSSSPSESEPTSQDDIDAMFGGSSDADPSADEEFG